MMFFFFAMLAVALALLVQRINRLETRLTQLESGAFAAPERDRYEKPVAIEYASARPVEASAPDAGRAPPSENRAPGARPPMRDTAPEPAETRTFSEWAARFRPSFDFEEIFGRLLPIWGGGVALAIAGFFLVRWSIEVGMLTQSVRVILGFVFGALLIAAAELAYRFEHRVSDARVRQALSGAGLATLYASFYLAGSYYALIGPVFAFIGMAAVTALALLLSFRFGVPSAILGLVGGFAAPALAGGAAPNLPLLATYLAIVTGGLAATGRRQERPWLGLAALAGGLGWGTPMLLAAPVQSGAILAIGLYLLLVGTLLPSLMGAGPLGRIGRIAAAGLATLQIAALVGQSGYSLLGWGCYLLLGGALAVLGLRFHRMREAGAFAAALSVCLLAAWPDAPGGWLAAIATALALIFAGAPLWSVWRGEAQTVDWAQLALYPVALIGALCSQRGLPVVAGRDGLVAPGALALAVFPALGAWRRWPAIAQDFPAGPFAALTGAFAAALLGGLLATPQWTAPLIAAILAMPSCLMLRQRQDTLPRTLQWAIALVGLVLLANTLEWDEVERLVAGSPTRPDWLSSLRWCAAAVPFVLVMLEETARAARRSGEAAVVALLYGAVAMLVPAGWLPLLLAGAALAVAWRFGAREAALISLLALGVLWAAVPLTVWTVSGLAALAGDPFLLGDLPPLDTTLRALAPLAVAMGGALALGARPLTRYRRESYAIFALLAVVLAHVVFKHVFAIADLAAFIDRGLAERTVWEAMLALVAVGLVGLAPRSRRGRMAAVAVAALALAHFALFGLMLHNPLWTAQSVGGWPIVNWLVPSYGIAIAITLWLRTGVTGPGQRLRAALDIGAMMLVALFALSELRQAFSGNLMPGPVAPREDLLRSILAIVIALGFLGWGAHSGQRSWRIGSLVLMLLAVFKVFVFDAAGLEGLARIASFFALGICLIGIGWFYSRQLKAVPQT